MSDKKAFAYFRVGNAEQLGEATDNRVFLYCRQSYDDSHFMNRQQEHLLRHCAEKGYQAAGSTAVVASAKDEKENMLRLAERLKTDGIKMMLISDPSRISLDPNDFIEIVSAFHKNGVTIEYQDGDGKYAMTELLVCGECKTPYRRCTWTVKGQKKIVWRCINRLDFGKKYCHNSPTVEESILQRAVMRAIMETAQQNLGVLQTLKVHIGMALENEPTEDNSMELQIRIAEIDAEFKAMLSKISTETVDAFDEEKAKRLMDEKVALQQQLAAIQDGQLKREQTKTRLDDIYTILDGLKNRPMEYDEQIVRQLLECITVDSKEQITVIFVGGLKVVQPLID